MSVIEKEVVRLFLNGSGRVAIQRKLKLKDEERDVIHQILFSNPATRGEFEEMAHRYNNGNYVSFFADISNGRPKKDKADIRKIRQIRMSDNELEELDNPTSTQMRNDLLAYKKIKEFCEMMDGQGIYFIPDDWLGVSYDKSAAFWQQNLYSSNIERLKAVSSDEKCLGVLKSI
ncbi:hypothetical protein [Alkalihalophilus marmarensis]|uniref:Uncharacterized protein n=1 Tax=Alkalihalophilus marmarensis DSM 21297 TaxID=1188261 RepID=U6SSE8_9BACI|nr:hypothetical protein [Alkalihalophilus marmarensis]ERN54302.1 hypothetical protein A33I_07700 [Alkalihalophilus marmarensis DSM 21297]